jgi:iron(III) transport system ATP-binding protein
MMTTLITTASISIKNLTKDFGPVKAVNDISLEVETGTLVCLLGPSGCGKTTTLRMVAGFEEPTSGEIYIGNEEITDVPPYSRPTALVFQSYALFPHMSVYDNIAYGLRARRVSKNDVTAQVQEFIKLMELEGHEKKSPSQLSGGQQQRVALARALVIRPKVLLFDEPLSNLDALLRVRMRSEIRRIQQHLGITSMYVTHDQEEAFSIGDRVALMNKGKLVQMGSPRELYREPADRFVAEFVGLSNIVTGEVLESNGNGAEVKVLGLMLHCSRPCRGNNRQVAVVLRPEALSLGKVGDQGLPARVLTLAFTGPVARYTVSINDGIVLTVDIANPSPDQFFEQGSEVTLHLPKEIPSVLE